MQEQSRIFEKKTLYYLLHFLFIVRKLYFKKEVEEKTFFLILKWLYLKISLYKIKKIN